MSDGIDLALHRLYVGKVVLEPGPSVTCIGGDAVAATFCQSHDLEVACNLNTNPTDDDHWSVGGRWRADERWGYVYYAPTLIDAMLGWCAFEISNHGYLSLMLARIPLLFATWRKPGTVILGGYRVEWIIGWTESDLRQKLYRLLEMDDA